jgi:hypothetical protein
VTHTARRIIVLSVLTLGGAAGAFAAGAPSVSWAPQSGGHRYGWAAEPIVYGDEYHRKWRCTPKAHRGDQHSFLCATDDGAKHWRPVFDTDSSWRAGGPDSSVLDVLRWSPRAGVVSIDASGTNFIGHQEFWTRDGGRHWWRTEAFDVGLSPYCNWDVSSGECTKSVDFRRDGRSLSFTTEGLIITPNPGQPPTRTPTHGTYRLVGWVPTGRISCPVRWTGSKGRRICNALAADNRLHAVPLKKPRALSGAASDSRGHARRGLVVVGRKLGTPSVKVSTKAGQPQPQDG